MARGYCLCPCHLPSKFMILKEIDYCPEGVQQQIAMATSDDTSIHCGKMHYKEVTILRNCCARPISGLMQRKDRQLLVKSTTLLSTLQGVTKNQSALSFVATSRASVAVIESIPLHVGLIGDCNMLRMDGDIVQPLVRVYQPCGSQTGRIVFFF
jgi:hypothetical protein